MAQALPKVEQDNSGLNALLKLFEVASGSMGSGKTTSTSTSNKSIDPGTSAQADALMAQILGGNDSKTLDDMIANIMERGKQSFAPSIGASMGAGNRAYSDTVLKQLSDEALARATGEAAGAKLQAINANNTNAARLLESKINNSSTTTNKTEQQTGATPMGKALQYGSAALGGYSLFKKAKKVPFNLYDSIFGEGASATSTDALSLLGESGGGPLNSAVPSLNLGGQFGTDFPISTGTTNFSDIIFNSAVGGENVGIDFLSALSGPESIGAGIDIGATAGLLGEGFSFGGGLDLGGGFGVADAAGAGAEIAGGAALGAEALGAGTAIAAGAEAGLGELALVATAWVICTELVRRGELDAKLYTNGALHISRLSKHTIAGYHYWAIPYTKLMRKYGWARKLISPWATGRARYLNGERNLLGLITVVIGEPLCWLIGKMVKNAQNWQSLYKPGLEG